MATVSTVALPPLEVLDAAGQLLQQGYDELERLVSAFDAYLEAFEHDAAAPPTLSDVGAVFSFGQELRSQLRQLERRVSDVEATACDLNVRRLDAEHRARRSALEGGEA